MKVLSGYYQVSRDAAEQLGYGPLTKRDFLSVPIAELKALSSEMQQNLGIGL